MVTRLSEMKIGGSTASFIEEEFGSGQLKCTFHSEPQIISESVLLDSPLSGYKVIGIAEGIICVLDGTSRNKRFYPADFWESIFTKEEIINRIKSRDMQGTIGHFDKKVDTEDWAKGLVSHVVSEVRIDRENKVVYGRLEILNTTAGQNLKALYEGGLPIYVSTRGAGKLSKLPGQDLDVVDKNNYYFETVDIVKDPGFLQARPNLIKRDEIQDIVVEEKKEEVVILEELEIKEEKSEMKVNEEKIDVQVTPSMDMEEIVQKMLTPIREELACISKILENITQKEDAEKEEDKEKKEEITEDSEEDDDKTEDKEVDEEKEDIEKEESDSKDEKEITEESDEEKKEEVKKEEEVDEEKKDSEEDEKEITEESDEAKKEDEKEEVDEEKKDSEEDEKEDKKEVTEEKDEIIIDLKNKLGKAEEETKETEKIAEAIVEKLKDYSKVVKDTLAVNESLSNKISECEKQLSEANFQLNARLISEEYSINIEDAKEKLKGKSVEHVKEELDKEKEEKEKEAQEKIAEELTKAIKISESKVKVPVFNRFINEEKEKKVSKSGVFNRFKN